MHFYLKNSNFQKGFFQKTYKKSPFNFLKTDLAFTLHFFSLQGDAQTVYVPNEGYSTTLTTTVTSTTTDTTTQVFSTTVTTTTGSVTTTTTETTTSTSTQSLFTTATTTQVIEFFYLILNQFFPILV